MFQCLENTQKRQEVVNQFARLEVATEVIRGKTTQIEKWEDFRTFVDGIVADIPVDREIHVILDNLSPTRKPRTGSQHIPM